VAVDPNAAKPGYYTVKQGDTLIRIGLESGQSHRDIARWNALENPNRIEIGQVLRVVPPEEAVVTKPVAAPKVTSSVLASAGAVPAPAPAPAKAASAPPATSSNSSTEDDIAFAWPAKGEALEGFDEAKNRKGLDIAGAAGDPVFAAADGKVVYADSGLRGYGKLIILKHNSLYLTAYAHNQTLLVKEDQMVKKGQKIAEMGNTDADRIKLHFEVRKQGKPVDPSKYLPAR
jgi:lipoprotein NlpD